MKLRLLTKQLTSQSLKRIANELTTRLGYKVWRSSKKMAYRTHVIYGDPVNKLDQYKWFKANNITAPEFTTNKKTAQEWAADGTTVFARKLLGASEGKGIVIAETPGTVPDAPVFTKYIKKKKEFRVHVFQDQVVSVVEKRLKNGWDKESDSRIRNTANGYVFCHEDVVEPKGIRELALLAAQVTPSDFKGVDIGWNEKLKKLFVIEVNSAPGIEGTNVQLYCDTILNKLQVKK